MAGRLPSFLPRCRCRDPSWPACRWPGSLGRGRSAGGESQAGGASGVARLGRGGAAAPAAAAAATSAGAEKRPEKPQHVGAPHPASHLCQWEYLPGGVTSPWLVAN
ncbi:single-pass membrane and coiled-coil domain-containing protein 4 isoform X1 [Paroedura picta]|uniref:single-pass membrane and coiled-coil domain-containing protein 4 isoform X1 n=1 Tax=Paroedura picta TaxID=143630 RepID=UPI004056AFCF